MMTNNEMREYVVVVNNGSGCIFQPLDAAYSYILTANHNLAGDGTTAQFYCYKFEQNAWVETEFTLQLQLRVNYFPHANAQADIAILKVPKITGLNKIIRKDYPDPSAATNSLLGFPLTRRGNADKSQWFRMDNNVSILDARPNGKVEGGLPGNPQQAEISGMSGGPIVKNVGGYLNLIGILNSMAHAYNEQLGRIFFSPIQLFDDIVMAHQNELSPIWPCYMAKFEFLKDDAFNLHGGFDEEHIEYTRNYLKNKTAEVINGHATPKAIKDYFKERILIYQQDEGVLQSTSIWKTWLEFLTILNVMQYRSYNEQELNDVFNSIRLLYTSSTGDWSGEVNNLVYSDYKGLKDGGVVIVGSSKPPINDYYIIDKDSKIPMITNARKKGDSSKFKIDSGITFPFDNYKFVHIEYFLTRSIVQQIEEFKDIQTEPALCAKLREKYEGLLGT